MKPNICRSEVRLPSVRYHKIIYNTGAPQIDQYIDKLGDISQSVKRCFNAAADINQLPVEILTWVFEAIQVHRSSRFPHPFAIKHNDDFSGAAKAIYWVPLAMHICNYWREVVLSTPGLWNDIYFDVRHAGHGNWRYYPPPSLLLRSCSAPLHIAAHVINHASGNYITEPTKLYDALRAITERAETFQLRYDGDVKPGIPDVLQYPFPQLTSLTLCLRMGGLENSNPAVLLAMIFGGELPRLRRLSLWFYNRWPHHKFPNLTHIAFNDQQIRPSINGFLDLLESIPCLEFLYLCEAGPMIHQRAILPQRMVSLPSLHIAQFTTKISAEPDNVRILECLTVPQLTRCLVRSVYRPPISPDIVETILTHINPEGITELRVYQPRRFFFYALEVDASRISVQTTPTINNSALVTMPAPRCTGGWNIKHLHLISDTEIPKVNWDSFPTLLSITCYDSLNGIKALVTSLSQQIKNGCPCPLLETVYLRVGEQLPDPMCVQDLGDEELVRGVLSRFPERMVVHRNLGSSYHLAFELRPVSPEEFQTEASITFPL